MGIGGNYHNITATYDSPYTCQISQKLCLVMHFSLLTNSSKDESSNVNAKTRDVLNCQLSVVSRYCQLSVDFCQLVKILFKMFENQLTKTN